jgi:CRP/FNR family transcriptional regulator
VKLMIVAAEGQVSHCLSCEARHSSICEAVPDADLASLAQLAMPILVPRGRIFIEEDEPAPYFFNVISGTAKLVKMLPDGRQQITGFAGEGYFLGLAGSRDFAFTAEALDDMRLCRFSRTMFAKLLDAYPALEHKLLETAFSELAIAREQMLLLGRKTARERLASFLLARLAEAAPCEQGMLIELPMNRGEIADYLGLTIETVSRTLSRFKAEQKIATPSTNTILVLDRDWLEYLAGGLVEDTRRSAGVA